MKNALIIGILCAAFLCGSCAKQADPEEARSVSAQLEKEISPNARVEWQIFCTKCGHSHVYFDALKVTGLTKTELARWYPEWHIAAFSREYSRLTRTLDAYCPEHYILYLERGIISVKTPVSPDLREEELAAFEAEPYEFDEGEKARLIKGAAFDSLVEADRFLTEHKKEGG